MLSAWSRDNGLRAAWHSSAGSGLPWRLAKFALWLAFRDSRIRAATRRFWWKRLHPRWRELDYGATSSVLPDPRRPDGIFKASWLSIADDAGQRQQRLDRMRANHEALRLYLDEYLAPTTFGDRDIGGLFPLSLAGSFQQWIAGEPLRAHRLRHPSYLGDEPHLREQWEDICRRTLRAFRETGLLVDLVGRANILIERPSATRSRLVIVDVLPGEVTAIGERTFRLIDWTLAGK